MTNQQLVQPIPATQAAPARGTYQFQFLPKPIQERLLYLQNTNGDFLRMSDGSNAMLLVLFAVVCAAFFMFVPLVAASGIHASNVIPAFVGSAIFLMWIGYLGWRVTKQMFSPIGNFLYLTPTQLIRVKNGKVSHRQLTDVREFHFLTIRGRGGPRYVLTCRLNDGDSFKFVFTLGAFSSKTAEAKHWRDRAAKWRYIADQALERGDTAYFNTRNVFQGLSEKEPPPEKGRAAAVLVILVLVTFTLPVLGSIAQTAFVGNIQEDEAWKSAVASDTVTYYQYYAKGKGKHSEEARKKINSFYDEDTSRIKSNQTGASDPKGVEAVLNLLESAQVKQDNQVILKITNFDSGIISVVREQISALFRETFPHETLHVDKRSSGSDSEKLPGMEVKISYTPDPPMTPAERRRRNYFDPNRVQKYDFSCFISVPDKPKYEFTVKAVTPEGFKKELAEHLGLTETTNDGGRNANRGTAQTRK